MWKKLQPWLSPARSQRAGAKKVIFLHVPKTGGSSFRAILRSVYGAGFEYVRDPSLEAIEPMLERCEAIEFHREPYGDTYTSMHTEIVRQRRWDMLAGQHCFIMLRDPVDQVISNHFYSLGKREKDEPKLHRAGKVFVDSLLESMRRPRVFNKQVGFLAGKPYPGAVVDAADLDLVREMLATLQVHVGLMERFDESMAIFEAVTGRRIPAAELKHENRSANRDRANAVPARIRDEIRERSALDIALYELGRELFLEDVARYRPARTLGIVTGTAARITPLHPSAPPLPTRKAAFVHIPRTGGRSMRGILAAVYGPRLCICDDPSLDAVAASMAASDCQVFHSPQYRGDLIHTHSNVIAPENAGMLAGSDIFTMFRDPIDHMISSHVTHLRFRQGLERLYERLRIPFPETMEQHIDLPMHRNMQLAFFLGKARYSSSSEVTAQDLAMAIDTIQRLKIHAGVTERFSEFLTAFETITGRAIPERRLFLINASPTRPGRDTISAALQDRIRDSCKLDFELYALAREITARYAAQHGPAREYRFE